MKKILFLSTLFTILTFAGLDAQTTTKSTEQQQISVKADGLSCSFCAYGLEKKFKEIDGALNIKIDIKSGILTFQMQKGKTIDKEAIRKYVKDAGFTPKKITFSDKPSKTKR